MLYHLEMHVPKNTTISDNYEERIEISSGHIEEVRIFFPWGCGNLCGVQIYRYEQQLMPLNRNEWLKGNDVEYLHNPGIDINDEPWELIIKSFNIDDIFEHKPVISVKMSRAILPTNLEKFIKAITKVT